MDYDLLAETDPLELRDEAQRLYSVLKECWEVYGDLMPEDLYIKVAKTLHMRIFTVD